MSCLFLVIMALALHSWASIESDIGLWLSNFGFQRYDLKVVGRGGSRDSNESCLVLNRSPLFVAFKFLDDRISVFKSQNLR
jgi:hypothetical protein